MLKEFKEFAIRGNVIDMAVGIIIGAAFGRIVGSLVEDVIMPPVGLLLGNMDFSQLYINLTERDFASLAEAKAAGAATINYGMFINAVLHFTIVAFAVFLLIRAMNRFKREAERLLRKHRKRRPRFSFLQRFAIPCAPVSGSGRHLRARAGSCGQAGPVTWCL
ncbi:MAG: large-conductance mechanosensitive channel protein MscL [Woeseia sp.]